VEDHNPASRTLAFYKLERGFINSALLWNRQVGSLEKWNNLVVKNGSEKCPKTVFLYSVLYGEESVFLVGGYLVLVCFNLVLFLRCLNRILFLLL